MTIELIPEMALSAADERAIADLLAASFATDFGGRSYYVQRHHLRLVLRDEGAIVGHMALLYRAIRQGNRLIDIVGLADVATAPGSRGKGIASRLLKDAIAVAQTSPASFLMLFGTAGLYGAHGFVAAQNELLYVPMEGAATGELRRDVSDALMVLPLRGADWDGEARTDLLGHKF